jgi:glycosyltransferase involved in cell wall biosynthesis
VIDHERRFALAVPELRTYTPTSGIGRVFTSLCDAWGNRIRLVPAAFAASSLPVLRNIPYGIRVSELADLVFLPKMTGAQALRNTSGLPSMVLIHDVGIIDELCNDRQMMDWFSYQSVRASFFGLRYARHIITTSQFTYSRLVHYLPEVSERVNVIHSGVNELLRNYERSQIEARNILAQKVKYSLHSPLLIYVGTELPRKNITLLLRAFAQIIQHFPGAQLLKVGGAGGQQWRNNTCRCIRELGLTIGKDVVFLENINDELLATAYRSADVFVSASLYEGFGLPALEAMAVGMPVVVTNCGAFPEVVGDAGWVVEPSVDSFVVAIEAALAGGHEAGVKARARASRFAWMQAANNYVDLIESLMHYSRHTAH